MFIHAGSILDKTVNSFLDDHLVNMNASFKENFLLHKIFSNSAFQNRR